MTMAGMTSTLYSLSLFFAVAANILVLCGLAGLQNVCHTGNDARTSLNTCSKAYRLEWYVMSLEFAFLLLAAWDFMGGKKKNGTMVIGGTATVLATILANAFLTAVDDIRGEPDMAKVFSRTTLTFIGFMLVAVFNYFLFLLGDACTTCCKAAETTAAATTAEPAKPAAVPTPAATVTQV
ncbi:hypothetical protein N2152v2_010853 [Parachlorella kessleri]